MHGGVVWCAPNGTSEKKESKLGKGPIYNFVPFYRLILYFIFSSVARLVKGCGSFTHSLTDLVFVFPICHFKKPLILEDLYPGYCLAKYATHYFLLLLLYLFFLATYFRFMFKNFFFEWQNIFVLM